MFLVGRFGKQNRRCGMNR